MPKKDGMTMIEEMSAIEENQKFIIVSAYKDEEFLFKSINLNVMGYFVKPLVVENIMQLLKKVKKSILENDISELCKKESMIPPSNSMDEIKFKWLYKFSGKS